MQRGLVELERSQDVSSMTNMPCRFMLCLEDLKLVRIRNEAVKSDRLDLHVIG